MIRLPLAQPALAVFVALALAAPTRAQTSGPVRVAALDAARLSAPAALRPSAAAAPSAVLMDTTKLSGPRLYHSAPLAAFLGVGGAILGFGSGLVLLDCDDEGSSCNLGPNDSEYLLAYMGLVIGATTGAHMGGKMPDSRGSVLATLGGAAIGALPLLIAPKDDYETGAYVGSIVGGTAGAVLLDYLVRRPRRRDHPSGPESRSIR